MQTYSRSIAMLIAACLMAGCIGKLPNAAGKAGLTKGEQTIRGSLPGQVTKTPNPSQASQGGGLLSNNGAGVIGNNAASLTGMVRCPASIIANNGGNIIANNGGGIVSNNSGSYRLLSTVKEVALAKVTVRLLDAEGKAIAGPDGKPLTAVTDASGRYRFEGIKPSNNLLLAVDLGDSGQLRAIAPRSGGNTRQVDLDLISSLTTGYILNQYVRSQPDQQKTLDKLPGSVESETRLKAASAFQAHDLAVPERLSDALVNETVTAMRQRNAAFDAQMEEVKRLLIAAGQSDLGNGRLGTEVALSRVGGLFAGADGNLLISCPEDRRLWRLDAQGRLQTAAGKGNVAGGSLNGVPGPQAGLARFSSVGVDAKGRALILENYLSNEQDDLPVAGRLSRLEADGKLTELWSEVPDGALVAPGQGDEVLVISFIYQDEGLTAELWSVLPGRAPQKKLTFKPEDVEVISGTETVVGDGTGRLYFLSLYAYDEATDQLQTKRYQLAPGASALSPAEVVPSGALVPGGHLIEADYGGPIRLRKADGTTTTLLTDWPSDATGIQVQAAALMPDGTAYLSIGNQVYRAKNGQATRVVGNNGAPIADKSTDLTFEVGGLAAAPDGTLYVADKQRNQVLRIGVDQKVTRFAGTDQEEGDESATAKALDAKLYLPGLVRLDGAGKVYFIEEDSRVRRVDPDGTLHTLYEIDELAGKLSELAVAPDGTLYIAKLEDAEIPDPDGGDPLFGNRAQLLRLKPGATKPTVLHEETGQMADYVLALGAAGTLYVASEGGKLSSWTEAKGFTMLSQDDRWEPYMPGPSGMAFDARGRLVVTLGYNNQVVRYDLGSKTFKTIAGVGGGLFNGTGVDRSLDMPGFPVLTSAGDLFFADINHRQVKRILAKDQ